MKARMLRGWRRRRRPTIAEAGRTLEEVDALLYLYGIALAGALLDVVRTALFVARAAAVFLHAHRAVVRAASRAFLRHVAIPFVIAAGGAWLCRGPIMLRMAAWARTRRKVIVVPPAVDVSLDWRAGTATLTAKDFRCALPPGRDDDRVVEYDEFRMTYSWATGAVEAVLEGLVVHAVAYDARLRDTNLNRFERRLYARDAAATAVARDGAGVDDMRMLARVTRGVVYVRAAGPLGTRTLVPPISLDGECCDSDVVASNVRFVAWVNALVVRSASTAGFGALSRGFDAVGGGVVGGVDAGLHKVAGLADRLPCGLGCLVKRPVTAASRVLAAAYACGSSVVAGVATAGTSLCRGLTFGSAKGTARAFADAETALVKGAIDGGKKAGEGVAGAGRTLARGSGVAHFGAAPARGGDAGRGPPPTRVPWALPTRGGN